MHAAGGAAAAAGSVTLPRVSDLPDQTGDRARTVRRLTAHGMSVTDATAAVDEDRVMVALLAHLLEGPAVLTAAEVVEATGLSPHLLDVVDRISGRPADGRYPERVLTQMTPLARIAQMVPEEALVAQLRGDLPAIRGMAMRSLGTIEHMLIRPVQAATDDPVEAAVRIAELGRPILDAATPLLGETYRRILVQTITSELVVKSLRSDQETVEAAVAFVDVIGYTSIAGRLDPTGLDEMLSTFEVECSRLVEEHPRVTLVKYLGDAAMFICTDPVELADALLDLVERLDHEDADAEAMPVSAGLALGPILARQGDWYGTAVNEAARLTDLARRHTVVAGQDLHGLLDGRFVLRRLPTQRLQGLGRSRPWAVRRS